MLFSVTNPTWTCSETQSVQQSHKLSENSDNEKKKLENSAKLVRVVNLKVSCKRDS